MKILNILVITAVAGFAAPGFAQTSSSKRIDARQAIQERRIEQGQKSGALTGKEAARLEKGQARVQKMEDKAMADGKLSAKERRRLENAQDRQSRKIRREKHDRQKAK